MGKGPFSAESAYCALDGCGTGTRSQYNCLEIPELQGSISSLSQHLLFPGDCVATSWFGTSTGEMAV